MPEIESSEKGEIDFGASDLFRFAWNHAFIIGGTVAVGAILGGVSIAKAPAQWAGTGVIEIARLARGDGLNATPVESSSHLTERIKQTAFAGEVETSLAAAGKPLSPANKELLTHMTVTPIGDPERVRVGVRADTKETATAVLEAIGEIIRGEQATLVEPYLARVKKELALVDADLQEAKARRQTLDELTKRADKPLDRRPTTELLLGLDLQARDQGAIRELTIRRDALAEQVSSPRTTQARLLMGPMMPGLSSSKRGPYVVFGGVLGGILGLVIAVIWARFRRTARPF